MTIAAILALSLWIFLVVGACWYLDSCLPSAEIEEAQAKRDMEEMLKQANNTINNRPRVRAGTQI